ncbi:MAG: HYR domain-containing protein [Chitinophagaceae bacterium]|nr:MAG: HYR domain-containing protein [Chitinophagaceae bacterium]
MCKQHRTAPAAKASWFLLPLLAFFLGFRAQAQCTFTVTPTIVAAGCGLTNGSVRLAVAPLGTYTYSWSPIVRTGANLLNVGAGTYNVTIRQSSTGCSQTFTYLVPQAADVTPPTIQCNPTSIYDNTAGQCGAFLQMEASAPIDFRMASGGAGGSAPKKDGATTDAGMPNILARANPGGLMVNNTIYTPVASDLCGAIRLTVVRSDAQPMTAIFPIGSTTLTWTAKDGSNNTRSCTQIIEVRDVEAPVVTLPGNLNVVTIPNGCGASVSWNEPTATDNCGVQSLTLITPGVTNGGFFTSGDHTITYRATDIHGNTVDKSFVITVADRVMPTILTCPEPVSVVSPNGCDAAVVLAPPTATDNCTPGQMLSIANNAPALFPVGTTIVTWTITDASGNSNTCSQAVTVADATAPVPVTATLPSLVGDCSLAVTPPQATDCNGIITATTSDATSFNTLGARTITWVYTDAAGNTSTQTQGVLVRDIVPPTVACPPAITVMATQACGAFVPVSNPPASDDCRLRSFVGLRNDGKGIGDCYPVGTTVIRWTATDWAGNTAVCDQAIIVTSLSISGHVYNDVNALTDGLINGTTISDADGQLYVNLVDASTNTVVASRKLTDGSFSFASADGLQAGLATYRLVLAASPSSASAALPVPAEWVNTGDGSNGTAGDGLVDGTFTFGAPVVDGQVIDFGIEARPVPNTFAQAPAVANPGGSNTVAIAPTLFSATDATDLNGAGVVKYIRITSFPTNTTTVSFAGAATMAGGTASALSYTAASFPAGGVYIATNASGNPLTAISADPVDGMVNVDFTYKAIDQADVESNNTGVARQPLLCPAPVITCPAAIAVNNDNNKCGAQVGVGQPAVSSTCGVSSLTGVRSDNAALDALYPVGTTTITWTAVNEGGNSSSCTQKVVVSDVTKPTLTAPAPLVQCTNGANNLTRTATAADNCSLASVSWTMGGATSGTGTGLSVNANFNVGSTTITWTARDAAGNSVSGATTVTINPLPVAAIALTSRDTLCNSTVLTGSGGSFYQWMNNGFVAGTSATLSLPVANCTGTQPFAPTAAAQNFNVFVQNGVTASAGDTHGPVAMGGNLTLGGQTIFTMNTNGTYPSGTLNNSGNYGMVIGGRVLFSGGNQSTVNQGYLRIGDATGAQIWYTDNNNAATNLKLTATGAGFNGNPSLMLQRTQPTGTATQAHGLNFAAAFGSFADYNSRIASWSTGTDAAINKITIPVGSNPHITLADNKINYISLTAAQLNALTSQGSIIFDNAPAANRTLVINVTLNGNFSWTPANIGGITEANGAHIIWNFSGTGALSIDGSNSVYGTVFAPASAIVKNNPANLNGQVIGQSLQVGPGEIHYYPFASGLSFGSGCSNTYSLLVTDANGCQSATAASYTVTPPVNTQNYTVVGLDAVTLADNNYVQSGSVGVNNAGGTATIQGASSISGSGAYLKAPVQTVAATASVATRYGNTAGYVLPAMQYFTGTYTGLNNLNVNVTVSGYPGNYGDVYVPKGANVTFSGSTFKSVTIEEGATANFSAGIVNLQNLTVGNGNNSGVATVNFANNANVRISGQLKVGMKSVVNAVNNRVYFFMGTDAVADKVTVAGRGATLNGVYYAPTGNIRISTDLGVPVVSPATASDCVQSNGCITVTYQGYTQLSGGNYRLRFLVKNQCGNAVSNMAFSLPGGTSSAYTNSNPEQSYTIENGTNNPFYSIKFNTNGEGIKNGQTETITYTLTTAQFNAMPTIKVAVKYATSTATSTFSREGCGSTVTPVACTPSYMNGFFMAKQVIADKCVHWNGLNCGSAPVTLIKDASPAPVVNTVQSGRMISSSTEAEAGEVIPAVTAFPNPARGNFQLLLRGFGSGPVQVQVVDAAGITVASRQVTLGPKEELVPVQLPGAASGLYTVRISGRGRNTATRVLIQR